MRDYDNWLSERGLSDLDIQSWGGYLQGTALYMPVYTALGTFQFSIVRRFVDFPRYMYDPKGSRIRMQLFGIHRAISEIVESRIAVIVEGFSDVIALHKSGVTNAVALLGSSLSSFQEQYLQLISDYIILWQDGDAAGRDFSKKLHSRLGNKFLSLEVHGKDAAETNGLNLSIKSLYDVAVYEMSRSKNIMFDLNGKVSQVTER